jgi:lysyl-tRNA synthetase class 2
MLPSAVESTTLARIAFDASAQSLWLEFRNGAVYRYFRVPPALYYALLEAPSKGVYFNRNIRGHFQYRKEQHDLWS